MTKMNIKKGDQVIVLSGKDKGKKGTVLQVMPKSGKVIVEKINVASCHTKPRKQGDQGGIIEREIPMYSCKVAHVCPKTGEATRVGYRMENGKKIRYAKKSGVEI